MVGRQNLRQRKNCSSAAEAAAESSSTMSKTSGSIAEQLRRRRPVRRAAAASAVATAAALSTVTPNTSLSTAPSSVTSSLSTAYKHRRAQSRRHHQTGTVGSVSIASSLASSSVFAGVSSSEDSNCFAASPANQLARQTRQKKVKHSRRNVKPAIESNAALPPPLLTAESVPSSTPMPARGRAGSSVSASYNLRSHGPPSRQTRHRRQNRSPSLSPPRLDICEEAVQQQQKEKSKDDSALLKAALAVLSPLRPVALLSASSSVVSSDSRVSNRHNNNNNSQQSTAGNSSQQEMSRKIKRVAKRRIEVDAGVAAAIANRQLEQQADDVDVTKDDDFQSPKKRVRQSPNSSFASTAVVAAAAVAIEDDERLLDQSLEHSYWRLYQECEYRDCVLRLCRQTDCVRWEDALPQDMLDGLHKVGEGVYGEVYASKRGRQEVALKVFPIEGGQLVNGEPQKMFHEVLPELLISRKLTNLAYRYRSNKTGNFVQLLNASIVRGRLHPRLSEEWEAFNSGVRSTDNENPEFLPARQQWLLLEYKFAGCPLPAFRFGCYLEARSVILQLALSLAAAESQFQFEHRDLHWNNVLVRRSGRSKIRYRIADHNYAISSEGLEVAIIDFTVSRISPAPGYVLYIDMSGDEGIFVGDGDYQFEVYRMMRRDCGDDWRQFNPRSNLMWLHYLLDKLLTATAFPRRDPDSLAVQSELAALHDCLLTYNSCEQLVRENFYFLGNAMDIDTAGLE